MIQTRTGTRQSSAAASGVPIPANESQRLKALFDLGILDTPPEEQFDRITRLASQLVGVPMVLITFIEEERQWYKSRVGVEDTEGPRTTAVCAYTIMGSDVVVIPNATEDAFFQDHPMVAPDPGLRFYAGAPLTVGDGLNVGTICAFDTKPHQIDDRQADGLQDLARIVVDELKLREHILELRDTRARLQEANQRLEDFAHITAHDLRAPVKTLINMSDLVQSTEGERRDRGIAMIREAAVEAESLISGYRRLSMLRLGTVGPVLVSEMVDEVASKSEQEVILEGDARLICDRTLMQQVFVNLVQNAERHAGGEPLTITCSTENDRVSIRASNPSEVANPVDDSIFAPFRQVTNDEHGTGLGLSIVNRIVQLHGGSASASSEGGVFAIDLDLPQGRGAA